MRKLICYCIVVIGFFGDSAHGYTVSTPSANFGGFGSWLTLSDPDTTNSVADGPLYGLANPFPNSGLPAPGTYPFQVAREYRFRVQIDGQPANSFGGGSATYSFNFFAVTPIILYQFGGGQSLNPIKQISLISGTMTNGVAPRFSQGSIFNITYSYSGGFTDIYGHSPYHSVQLMAAPVPPGIMNSGLVLALLSCIGWRSRTFRKAASPV